MRSTRPTPLAPSAAASPRAVGLLLAVGLILVPTLAACQSTPTTSDAVAVKATDTECTLASTNFEAGSVTFAIANGGSKVTEVYVYGANNTVVAERENIGPGTSADLTTQLAAGTYEVACKPGQTRDGIRQTITVTGGAAPSATSADGSGSE